VTRRSGDRAPFPESDLPRLNHLVVTGTLVEAPGEGRSPRGDIVTLLRLAFPVRDPERPGDLWTDAGAWVELPERLTSRSVPELRVGDAVLASGQVSERDAPYGGHQDGVGPTAVTRTASSLRPPSMPVCRPTPDRSSTSSVMIRPRLAAEGVSVAEGSRIRSLR